MLRGMLQYMIYICKKKSRKGGRCVGSGVLLYLPPLRGYCGVLGFLLQGFRFYFTPAYCVLGLQPSLLVALNGSRGCAFTGVALLLHPCLLCARPSAFAACSVKW